MEYGTSRDDVGIAIRSAFLRKSSKQKFSLFALIFLSIFFLFLEAIDWKIVNQIRSLTKDTIYRGSLMVSYPTKGFSEIISLGNEHINLYEKYNQLKEDNKKLKSDISRNKFLELENSQLRKLIDEKSTSSINDKFARVMLDIQSPYLNSFIINVGGNQSIKNGMAVLHGKNFIGRIVDVNYFSSRVLLVSDLNSKIAVLVEPSGSHAILSGHGEQLPTLEYLSKSLDIKEGDKIYTSGKEGIFSPGIPIGEVKIENKIVKTSLFSDLKQVSFVKIRVEDKTK
ncbi:MAG: rod shape-determining protein MreC [Pelagibacterales bacterium]|nr:rod shape-determining protein MreC [Pelagibacterales bacterium]